MPSLIAAACFLPGRAKDLSTPPRMYICVCTYVCMYVCPCHSVIIIIIIIIIIIMPYHYDYYNFSVRLLRLFIA